jgi:Ca-activated chloride channel homolog
MADRLPAEDAMQRPMKLIAILLCGGVIATARQVPAEPGGKCTVFRAEANLVTVPVNVFDNQNRVVNHLDAVAFHVFEDGVEQRILSFGEEDVPASIGFVLDTSGSMGVKLDLSRQAIAQFLRTANPDDEFFLLPFDSHPGAVTGFTSRPEQILERVALAKPAGTTAMLDAIQSAFVTMRHARHARRAIIIVSDGGDNHSRATKTDVLRMAREADAQVFTLGTYELPAARHRTPEEFTGPELLAAIAEQSGGRSFPVRRLSDITDAALRIGFELRNQYVIAYRPENQAWDGLYRRITVETTAPGFPRLHTYWRRGYYAAPPACAASPTS